MTRRRAIFLGLLLVLLAAAWVATDVVARRADRRMNALHGPPPAPASAEARRAHEALTIADLHADVLLWDRDLLERGRWGHVDVPRLLDANVAVQVFGVVTKTPKDLNIERNDDTTDDIRLLALAQKWPPPTWWSLLARAEHQARRLHRAAAASDGRLVVARTRGELDAALARRAAGERLVVGLLALEGMHALEGDLANVDRLFDAGFRMLGPAHFFDNDVAGSAHGIEKGGLTALGREALARMEARGMTLDLAHASPAAFDEALALATKPVVVSHTGVRGTCDNQRNLSDDQLRAIARNGGVVGIGFWPNAVCGTDAAAIAAAIRHAIAVAGIDHVALGSDYDGAVAAPFDVTGLPALTEALLAAGLSGDELAKVMGGNTLRVLRANLPP